jgi:hypothetical protein
MRDNAMSTAVTMPATISAIVPAYNVEQYVGAALDSLIAQSAPFHEIIVIDDGSTDGTAVVLDKYRNHPGMRIVHVANGGQGRARNQALAMATGEFVYFFDSDDLLETGFVADMQAMLAARPDTDIIYFSGSSFVDPDCSVDFLPMYKRGVEGSFASGVEAAGALLRKDTCFASPCLYLSRRTLWTAGEGGLAFLPIVHEDEEIITRLVCMAGASQCVDTVYFARRVRPGSTMTQAKSERHAVGYLHTLAALALQCKRDRKALAPIHALLVRRFYALLRGYIAICKACGVRPRYRELLGHIATLGRAPSLRQVVEMVASPEFKARLGQMRRTLTFSRQGQH